MNYHKSVIFGNKLISLALSIALVLASVPFLPVAAGSGPEFTEDVFISAEYNPGRREYEKHFLLSDGSFMAVSYPDAVHYKDAEGVWIEVDNRLFFD